MRLLVVDIGALWWARAHSRPQDPWSLCAEHMRGVVDRAYAGLSQGLGEEEDRPALVLCLDGVTSFRDALRTPEQAAARAKAMEKRAPAGTAALEALVAEMAAQCAIVLRRDGYDARDVVATVAAWWDVDQRDRLRILTTASRLDLAAIADDAAGIEVAHEARGSVVVEDEGAVARRLPCSPDLLADLQALASLPGIGDEPRAGGMDRRSTAQRILDVFTTSTNACAVAADAGRLALVRDVDRPTPRVLRSLRDAGADDGAGIRRALALVSLRVIEGWDVGAELAPRRSGGQAIMVERGGADAGRRAGDADRDRVAALDGAGSVTRDRCPCCNNPAGTGGGCPACAPGNNIGAAPRATPRSTTPAPTAAPERIETMSMQSPVATNPDAEDPPEAAAVAAQAEPTAMAPQETPAEAAARTMDVSEFAATAPAAPSEALTLDPSDLRWSLALQPTSAREAMILATVIFKSGVFPLVKYRNRDMVFAVIEMGRERGISAMIALQSMHVIEGKVEMSADLMAALVLRSGKAKRFACVETTDELAVYEAQRFDDPTPMRITFTKKNAIDRGLWGKGNWAKMPDVMLAHRACTKAARLKFPEVTVGIYGTGEIRETRMEDVPDLDAVASAAIAARDAAPANGTTRRAG